MQKLGKVHFLNTRETYDIVWVENGLELERIDVIPDLNDYNFIDTSNCTAAYYRKNRERYYGDSELIKRIRKIKNVVLTFKAHQEQSIEVKEGIIYITQTKIDNRIGMKYILKTKNGLIYYEYYETPDGFLEIYDVSKDKGMDIAPINLSMYTTYSVVDTIIKNEEQEAEYYSLEYLKSLYPLDHIEENDFVVITSLEEAESRLEKFKTALTKVKSVDLETTGTEIGMYGQDIITGIVLSYEETESTYYPFRQEKCEYNLPLNFLAKILDAINNQPKDVLIVAHNGKFEIQGIWKEASYYLKYSSYAEKFEKDYLKNAIKNTYLRIDRDSFILSTLVDPRMQKGLHSLKSLVYRVTGLFYLELDKIFKNPKNIRFNVLPPDIIRYYACPDTANTIKVYKYLMSKLPPDEEPLFVLESKLIYVKAQNEFYGMRTNRKLLVESIENEEFKVKTLGNMFKQIHHTNKNINSPEVRRDIFYNKLRCPVEVRTNTGQPSTSAIALQRIVDVGTLREYDKSKMPPPIMDLQGNIVVESKELASNKYPSLVILNKYTKAMKELGAFRRIERKSLKDRVMFNINQTGAGSGRQTSDAHQYSDGMKKLIIPDSDQHFLWSADFKQIELRILAYLSQQLDLIELESDMDVDVHRAILSIITGKPMWAISAKERKEGKSVNFGVVYMMSEFGLAKKEAGPAYTKDDLIKALNSINGFYNGLPQVKAFVEGNKKFVKEHGYIMTRMKRRRYFPEILNPTISSSKEASIVRAANNTPVQGFGADFMKLVEVNLNEYIKMKGWDEVVDCDGVMLPKVRLMLSIHDEVLVSTYKTIPIEEIIIMFKKCMEIKIKGAPPFFSAPAMIQNWYDGKNDAYEIDLRFRDEIIEAWEKNKTTLLHPDTYLEDLNNFRARRLNNYMDNLIKEYKTIEEVALHVQHPELTHTLISVYLNKEASKYSHMEAIMEATKRYMDKREIEANAFNELLKGKSEEEFQDNIETYDELTKYMSFDENGELIIENENEFDYEEDNVTFNQDYKQNDFMNIHKSYVVYSLNDVIVDLSDFGIDGIAEEINQEIAKKSNAKEFYHVIYLIKGKLLRTKLKVGYIPDDLNEIIRRYVS